ncbi:MAG: tetratricopeptide repeat protein [Hydrococcus sp. RM1_1_31]|nr:tetratricopeptide repeat protein [Hydrococcus sp. RM1_1_31]
MINLAIAVFIFGLGTISQQTQVLAELPPPKLDPLEQPVKDPLLPTARERSLTPFERRRLREALDALNAEAQIQFQAGNIDRAFEIWYRELRLRRSLGRLEEIQALARVGQFAWDKTRKEDVQIINRRLNVSQQEAEAKAPLSPELLKAFATAYQQVHSIDSEINIYQKMLANTRQQKDPSAEEEVLKSLGQSYLAKFDYLNAGKIYEDLLKRAQAQKNAYDEGIYLQQLANIYNQALQPQNALRIKEQLAEIYLNKKQIQALPELKIEIGDDYQTLKRPELASQNYQEAFSLAWSLQQFGTAGDALTKLGDLYQDNNRDDYALKIYQELVKVKQQSYDYYGLMQTYDRIGKIHLKQNNYPQALAAFQKALELARSISYQEDYFSAQIEKINQQINQ